MMSNNVNINSEEIVNNMPLIYKIFDLFPKK